MTSDACETEFPDQHESVAPTVQMHNDTSPLDVSQLPETLPQAEQTRTKMRMVEIVMCAIQYMCPADSSQWSEAQMQIYLEQCGCQK